MNYMGIKDLVKIIEKNCPQAIASKSIEDYKNCTLGFDAHLLLYRIIMSVRMRGDIKKENVITTHINAMLQQLYGLHKYNINAIFVFDNKPDKMKDHVLKKRRLIKTKYNNYVSRSEIEEVKKLIELFGQIVIVSKEEADSELVSLYNLGFIDYIVSNDADILLFGGEKLLKNFSIQPKKKIMEINLNIFLKKVKLSIEQMIDIGILIGCDYCESPKNIGPNKAFSYIKQYNSIDNMIKKKIIEKINGYEKTKNYFLKPVANAENSLTIYEINIKSISKFLNKYKYSKDEIEKIITKFDFISN